MSQIAQGQSAERIIKHNDVAVGGGVIFGTRSLLRLYVDQYRRAVRALLNKGWMSTDQQVIYSAYSDKTLGIDKRVPLKLYFANEFGHSKYNSDPWFYLAYLMRSDTQCPNKVE